MFLAAANAKVDILVSCAHSKLQQDREASSKGSTWLREGCDIVCATVKLGMPALIQEVQW